MKKTLILITTVLLAACGGGGEESTGSVRGVTADSITLGSHTDLSGPVAVWGVGTSNGQRMRYDEVNALGGVHGRKIELVVEDTGYQVPAAVKATNKLLNVDNIFLMVGALGTPANNAVLPRMLDAGVPNLFPLTAAVQMYEPLHPMKFSAFVSYRDQVRSGVAHMVKQRGVQNVCLQAVATDYGEEVHVGFEQAVEELSLTVSYVGRHKGTETDYSGTVTSIRNSDCELLVLGPLIKDAILIYTAARDAGWDAPIVGNMVPYSYEVAAAPGMDGFYSVAPVLLPDFAAESQTDSWVGNWYRSYVERYNEEPPVQAVSGYVMADLTVRALEAAGPDLTTDKVLAALEGIDNYQDPFGGPSMSFSATKHQGADYLNLYQVRNGKWETVETRLPY
ncbi:MAG: ABC transporter substrate-binding protein [Xanthomonadales bacterium]|nr:ABC transporter substrate-binding protein [Xanthomonadales bacterium]